MTDFIGNWIKLNPQLESHRIGYQDVLKLANAGASGAFKLAPVLPPMSAPFGELRSRVLNSQRLRNAVELLTASLNRPATEIAAIAAAEYDSMAANLDPTATRALFFLTAPVLNRIFSHIFVNCQALERIRTAMNRHPVILLPTHRSYMDFILLDIALYICDMPLPTIAAATDFSSMRVVGEWLRRCGAFFVQRGTGNAGSLVTTTVNDGSTTDESRIVRPLLVVDDDSKANDWKFIASDYLHRALLAEYVYQLIVYGHHRFLEFFIEGKRSRTGKACPPKRGLLNSIAEAFVHGDVDDIYLCPVSISYDRFLEESLYARELLGWPKPKESTLGLLKSTKVLLSNNYGSAIFTFGEPISLREKATGRVNRHLHALHPAWIGAQTIGEQKFMHELSLHIIDMHHQLTSLPVFSLVACCITSAALTQEQIDSVSSPIACKLPQLVERVRWLVGILTASNRSASLSISHSLDSTILEALHMHANVLSLNRENGFISLKGIEMSSASPAGSSSDDLILESLIQLCVYRNQAMFALFSLTAISLAITSLKQTSHDEITADQLFDRYAFVTCLLHNEFVSSDSFNESHSASLHDAFNRTTLFMLENHLLFKSKQSSFDVQKSSNPHSIFLASLIQPFVFGYSLCCSFLLLRTSAPAALLRDPKHAAFLERLVANPARTILANVLSLAKAGVLPPSSAWSISSDLIPNALATFTEFGLMTKSISRSKPASIHVHKMEEFQEKIASYLPSQYPSTASTLSSLVFFSPDLDGLNGASDASKPAAKKSSGGVHSKL